MRPILYLLVASVFVSSFPAKTNAQTIPPYVKKALSQLVGEWSCETTVDGEKSLWELQCRATPDGTAVTYYWSGTDILTGNKNSGSGILGWDAAKQLVVEQEIDSDGTTYRSTHHILESGEWRSPTQGSTVVDGKPVHVESLRFFSFTPEGEWHGRDTNRVVGGKPMAGSVTVSKRKQ